MNHVFKMIIIIIILLLLLLLLLYNGKKIKQNGAERGRREERALERENIIFIFLFSSLIS